MSSKPSTATRNPCLNNNKQKTDPKKKKTTLSKGQMVLLPEDPGLGPSTDTVAPVPGGPSAFCPLQAPGMHLVHICKCKTQSPVTPGCFYQPHNISNKKWQVCAEPSAAGYWTMQKALLLSSLSARKLLMAREVTCLTLSACFCCVDTVDSVRSSSPTRCREDCRRLARSSDSPGSREV